MKLIAKLISVNLLLAVNLCALLSGCSGSDKSTSLVLPDSALVAHDTVGPIMEGGLEDFYHIRTQPYIIDMSDTVPEVSLLLDLQNRYTPNEFASSEIESPYVVFVDSTGTEIPGCRMILADPNDVVTLNSLMNSTKGSVTVPLKFRGERKLSPECGDSISTNAYNLKLVAPIKYNVDSSKIDEALSEYRKAVNKVASARTDLISFGFGSGAMDAHIEWDACIGKAQILKNGLNLALPNMTTAQTQQYRSICNELTRASKEPTTEEIKREMEPWQYPF